MENGPITDNTESKQAHENRRTQYINRFADIIQEEKAGELTAGNLMAVFSLTTKSLLDNGLVEYGRIYGELQDNGDIRKVSDLLISAEQAQERVLDQLNATDAGGWGGLFERRTELIEYMNKVADRFEKELLQILEDKEVIHG